MRLAMLFTATMLVVGCAKKNESNTALGNEMKREFKGAPDWVTSNCAAWSGFKKRADPICATGSVGGTSNVSMARDAAASRARTELARQLSTRVESMLKDYQATAAAGAPLAEGISDEQYIVNVTRQITQTTVSGAEIKDSWISDTGTFWAMVAVDTEKFAGMVDEMQELSDEVKNAIKSRLEAELDDLDENLE